MLDSVDVERESGAANSGFFADNVESAHAASLQAAHFAKEHSIALGHASGLSASDHFQNAACVEFF